MKKVQEQLISVSKTLATLLEAVEKITAEIAEVPPAKEVEPVEKTATAKKTTRKAAKKVTRKPVKKATQKAAVPSEEALPAKPVTVFDTVYEVIRRSRNGATIAKLKEKTSLNSRQISNAVYKLSRKGKIVSLSRGVYTKKK